MAQSLVIRNQCDICLADGKETPADTYSVDVQIVASDPDVYKPATSIPPVGNPRPFVVELCPEHASPLAEAVLAVLKFGRPPERTPAKAPAGATPAKPRRDQQPAALPPCPECGRVAPSLSALRTHLREHHDTSLASVGLEPANFTCADCGDAFAAGQGYASHVRRWHPDTWARVKKTA